MSQPGDSLRLCGLYRMAEDNQIACFRLRESQDLAAFHAPYLGAGFAQDVSASQEQLKIFSDTKD